MRKRIALIILFGILVSLAVFSGTPGATNTSEYNISISGSLDVPDRSVNFDGKNFTISRVKTIDPGESFTANLDVPSGDTDYSVQIRDQDSNTYDAAFFKGDESVTFDAGELGLGAGAYSVAIRNDTFRDIQRVIVEGYDVRVTNLPDSAEEGSTITINGTASEKSGNDQEFTGVELVILNDTVSRSVNLSKSDGDISNTVSLDGLSPGTYSLYLVARGNETSFEQKSPLGFSSTQTLVITSDNANSLDDIGLASDIPGPIEYRGTNHYQVVVGFDRHMNDTSNIDIRVTGTNPDGGTVDTGNLTVSAGSVTTSDGVAADGSALNNSVLRIDVGTSTDESNNIVTDGNLQVWNNTASSLISEFNVIGTSAQIDAGNPENNSVVYGGERVAVYNLTGQHDKYEVFNGGNFQFSGQSGDNQTVTIQDTGPTRSTFEVRNTYRFDFIDRDASNRIVNGSTTVEFRDLNLSITLDSVTNQSGQNATLSGTVFSDVANRNIELELLVDGEVNRTQSISLRGDGADREADFTFANISVDTNATYSVRAIDLDTGIQDTRKATPKLNGPQEFTYELTLLNGTTHALGFPGPVKGTYGDVFGGINGTIWTYDAATETWRHPDASESIDALDAAFVIPEERASVRIDFADSESGPRAPGEKRVHGGWNFIGAPHYGGAENAFAATTAEPKRILQIGSQPRDQPFRMGDDFGWYAFGQDTAAPRVSAFTGYWVFMAENGTVGANLYRGVTLEEAEKLLTEGGD